MIDSLRQTEKDNGAEYHEKSSGELQSPSTELESGETGHVRWTFKTIIATICLCGIWVGAQIPLYFVGGSLGYIVADIGSPGVASWLTVSYTLAIGAIAPFCGYLADIFGQRNITLGGAALVIIGNIVVGTAHNFSQCTAGMTLTGVGAAITELNALAAISSIVPIKHRGYYLALCTAFLIPWTPYVMYTQLLSTKYTWRWGIWICLIYNCVCTVGLVVSFFPERGLERITSKRNVLKDLDAVGGLLSITGITLLLVALGSGGYTHSWGSAYVLATLIIGIALIVAFVGWEWKGARVPIVPKDIFAGETGRIIAMAYVVAFVGGINLYSLLNFFPLTFSAVFNPDPIQVGLKGLGYGISVTLGATIFNGLLSVFPKHNRELLVISAVLMTAFIGALAAVTPSTPKLAVALGTIAGFGVGGIYVPAATIALQAAPDALLATVVALSLSVRTIGGSIGYTIYFNVYKNKITNFLPKAVGAAAVGAGLPSSDVVSFVTAFATAPSSAASLPGVTTQIIAAATEASRSANAHALSYVWYVSIAFGVCSIIAAAFVGNIGRHMTNHIAGRIV